jgi:hypothetical protein
MGEGERDPVLVMASEAELPPSRRVWGTGAWFPPEEREALDWLTLCRLLGWAVTVRRRTRSGLDGPLPPASRWVIVACDPAHLGDDLVAALEAKLAAEPILVVARAAAAGGAFGRLAGALPGSGQASARSLRWLGPGAPRTWPTRNDLGASALDLSDGAAPWATLDGAPVIAARHVGRGVVATLGFHPSCARDADGVATALLAHLLVWGVPGPVAWLDLAGSLVLRMDDPGGAQNVHLRGWYHAKLGEDQWARIAADLETRDARMSIAYVAGWVDDGDSGRGTLEVAGREPRRVAGRIHPSPLVRYEDRAGHAPGTRHDYTAEFRGIQALRAAGAGDVEVHGYTHMHPDTARWTAAPDRYEATAWFRELGPDAEATIAARPRHQDPLGLGVAALREYFGARPTALVCPGDEWTEMALERALDLELQLVSNYYLALRDGDRFCWTTHVCAPYLSEPGAGWFSAGLPVVGYFHDRDPALEGAGWIGRWLDAWSDAGARRYMDLRELAAAVGRGLRLEERNGSLHLMVERRGAPALTRPLTIAIRPGRSGLPATLSASLDDRAVSVPVEPRADGAGSVGIPSEVAAPEEEPRRDAGWLSPIRRPGPTAPPAAPWPPPDPRCRSPR